MHGYVTPWFYYKTSSHKYALCFVAVALVSCVFHDLKFILSHHMNDINSTKITDIVWISGERG